MNTQITPPDIELLSAYLDQELDPAESARLEARLSAEPELNGVLRDLRRTRQVLRSLPIVRAPRNFTLSPDAAGIRRKEPGWMRWFSSLRLSSAMAGVLLVLVLIGDFLAGLTPLPAALSLTAADTQVEEAAEAAPVPESFGALESPATESGTLAAEGELRIQVVPELEMKVTEEETPQATPEELLTIPEVITGTLANPQQPPARGLGGGGGGGGAADGVQAVQEPLFAREDVVFFVRTLEISLALIAIGAALAAWLLSRRKA